VVGRVPTELLSGFLVRQLCSNRKVPMHLRSLSLLLSWLAGAANPGPAVYPVQKVFGCEGDEPT